MKLYTVVYGDSGKDSVHLVIRGRTVTVVSTVYTVGEHLGIRGN